MNEKGSPAYQLFLLILSLYVLVVLFAEMFMVTDPEISRIFQYIDMSICMVFLGDFFWNLYSAKDKRAYMKWGWIDFLSSIPLIDPFRWGRISKLIRIFRFLKTIKSVSGLVQSLHTSKFQSFTLFVLLVTFITYTFCASAILDFERSAGGDIKTANDALWWAFLNVMNAKVSMSQAQSSAGIVATVVLNKVGLLLFAYVNAMMIAWLIKKRVDFKSIAVVTDSAVSKVDSVEESRRNIERSSLGEA